MKKIITVFLILLVMSLAGCVNTETQNAFDFVSELSNEQMSKDYTVDEITFGLELSTDSPKYVQYMETNKCIVVNIKEERVFVFQDESSILEPNDILSTYYYVKSENILYKIENESDVIIDDIHGDSLEEILDTVYSSEGYLEDFIQFDSLYQMINTFLNNTDIKSISAPSSNDLKLISITLNKGEFIDSMSAYNAHISSIFNSANTDLINQKILNSTHTDFHLKLLWDSENNMLVPYFTISFQNFTYYQIGSVIDDFVVDIPKCY